MPISFTIHADFGLLVTRFVGVVASDEYVEVYRSILGGSEFRHGFNELADFQEITEFNVTARDMMRVSGLVRRFYGRRSESTCTAIIAPRAELYGMGRMYTAFTDPDTENVEVFKDVNEAMRWLGLNSVSLAELHGEKSGLK